MFGMSEILLLLCLVFAIAPLVAAVDAARLPGPAWEAVGIAKPFWVGLLAVGVLLLGLGVVFALIYFISVRPKVALEARDPNRPTLTP